jgi:hypothetical protein
MEVQWLVMGNGEAGLDSVAGMPARTARDTG